MALTDFVQHPEVRNVLDTLINWTALPQLEKNKQPLAPPLTDHYGLVGTAFDYLYRFHLEATHLRIAKPWPWIASLSLKLLQLQQLPVAHTIKQLIQEAKQAHYHFIVSRQVTDSLLQSCLILAQIDTYYRRLELPHNLGQTDSLDVNDLRNLYALIPSMPTPRRHLLLNPNFDLASELVNGADADVILDNSLIEVKTSKYLDVKKDYIYQLVGYYILNLLSKKINIQTISIYFSRFGKLVSMPVPALLNTDNLKPVVAQFVQLAHALYS